MSLEYTYNIKIDLEADNKIYFFMIILFKFLGYREFLLFARLFVSFLVCGATYIILLIILCL